MIKRGATNPIGSDVAESVSALPGRVDDLCSDSGISSQMEVSGL